VLFQSADEHGTHGLTQDQTVNVFAQHVRRVASAAAQSIGDKGEMGWMVDTWVNAVRGFFSGVSMDGRRDQSQSVAGGGPGSGPNTVSGPGSNRGPLPLSCDFVTLKALAHKTIDLLSELAVDCSDDETDAGGGTSHDGATYGYGNGPSSARHDRNYSGPPSSTAGGIADMLVSFAAGGGLHGGSRDNGSVRPSETRDSYEHTGGASRERHRRASSYESAHDGFVPVTFATRTSGPNSVARTSHKRGVSDGASLTPYKGSKQNKEGGMIWQMFNNIHVGYTKGRSKTAGNESEIFGDGPKSFGTPSGLKIGAGSRSGGESHSPSRLSPIDSPRSPENTKRAGAGVVSFGREPGLERTQSGGNLRRVSSVGTLSGVSTRTREPVPGRDEAGVANVASDDDEEEDESDDYDDDDDDEDEDEYTPKATKSDLRRERLRLQLKSAQEDTKKAESEQTVSGAEFDTAVAFAQELGVRMFLYNIVKMLLIIALIAADASICVWTMFHFGIVVGLSVVMVINVGLALLFGYFVIRYTEREKGQMHMEYGLHAFKGVTDLFDQNSMKGFGESLAMVTSQIQTRQDGGRGAGRGGSQVPEDVL